MGLVGGSRHYDGGGLGEAAWDCPSCGAENTGPLAQGCQVCGAGRPGHRAEAPPPPPKVDVGVAPPELVVPPPAEDESVFTRWLAVHPQATLEEAFLAGYIEGIRATRRAERAAPAAPAAQPQPPELPSDKVARTMVAALALFRDQILAGDPEEVSTGEWLSADEVTTLITELQTPEHAHA